MHALLQNHGFRQGVRTGLAMVIAYAVALSMNWDRPMWAGFTVGVLSLDTTGASFAKACMRIAGTLVAGAVALSLIALFPQDRWTFLFFLATYVALCAYLREGSEHPYFWYVAGFVCPIIAIDAGPPDALTAFETAIERFLETGTGILAYTLVSMTVFRQTSKPAFDAATVRFGESVTRIFRSYYRAFRDQGAKDPGSEPSAIRDQAMKGLASFGSLLQSASVDSYTVWEVRHQWREASRLAADTLDTLERWRQGFPELTGLPVEALFPGLAEFESSMEDRFAQIRSLLGGEKPDHPLTPVSLELNSQEVKALDHFQRAAVMVSLGHLRKLEKQTRLLWACLADLRGFERIAKKSERSFSPSVPWTPNLNHLLCATRVFVTAWLASLLWIAFPGLPGGASLVSMGISVALVLAPMSSLDPLKLFPPFALVIPLCGLGYIFVLPQLSGFASLASYIFVFTFAICFAFQNHAITQSLGLVIFTTVNGFTNSQSFSFVGYLDSAAVIGFSVIIACIVRALPFSPRPEKVFLRSINRFFGHCIAVLSTNRHDDHPMPTWWWRRFLAYHQREIAGLPREIELLAPAIEPIDRPGGSTEPILELCTRLESVSVRMLELAEVRESGQAEFLVRNLRDDVVQWRSALLRAMRTLGRQPEEADPEHYQVRLQEILAHLEARTRETLDALPDDSLDETATENFYSLLGAFRGISESIVGLAGAVRAVNWNQWRESRF